MSYAFYISSNTHVWNAICFESSSAIWWFIKDHVKCVVLYTRYIDQRTGNTNSNTNTYTNMYALYSLYIVNSLTLHALFLHYAALGTTCTFQIYLKVVVLVVVVISSSAFFYFFYFRKKTNKHLAVLSTLNQHSSE